MSSEASSTPMVFNDFVARVIGSLQLLVDPAGAVELRALKCQTGNSTRPHTRSAFYDFEHLHQLAHEAVNLSHLGASAVYVSLNPVHRDLLSRRCNRVDVAESGTSATDANITRRRWLLVDADPKRIADVSSTDAEKASAWATVNEVRTYLREQSWPEPLLADSGNGYHLLYRVDEPVDDRGLVERCLRALAGRFDDAAVKIDTQVYNLSRVVKLYGTVCRKGDHTEERPHRLPGILEGPSDGTPVPVPVERLEALAATAPSPSAISEPSAPSGARKTKDVLARAKRYLAKLPKAVSGQGGHAATFRAACSLVLGFDLTPDEAYLFLAAWNQAHCEGPWDEHDLRHKLQDADKKDEERGYLFDRRRANSPARGNGPHQAMANGVSASAVSADGGGAD